MCRCDYGSCGDLCDCRCHVPSYPKELRAENMRLQKALKHAASCPLLIPAKNILGEAVETMAVCDGCRDTLVLMKELNLLEVAR